MHDGRTTPVVAKQLPSPKRSTTNPSTKSQPTRFRRPSKPASTTSASSPPPNYSMRSTFRKRLRELNEPYVLEIETGRPYAVSEETELLNPGNAPGPDAQRKYPPFRRRLPREPPPKSPSASTTMRGQRSLGSRGRRNCSPGRSTESGSRWCRTVTPDEWTARPGCSCSSGITARTTISLKCGSVRASTMPHWRGWSIGPTSAGPLSSSTSRSNNRSGPTSSRAEAGVGFTITWQW